MNAMVDTITDAVETAIVRSNAPSGPPRFMLQSAVRRALRDINERRTPLRRSNGVRTADSARRSSPRTPSLQFAPGTGPTHVVAAKTPDASPVSSAEAVTVDDDDAATGAVRSRYTMDSRRWNHGWTPRHSSGLQQQRRGGGLTSGIRIRP
ncbi:hypothetical protein PVAP13_3KG351281 [Panicum virgatum]|uniref:Uncharacterized protein n=1 Tax=Panicum virgatum TaxID=38727 RepID=A0A8T0UQH5_PANVG|nr:hypothetical protein PVAP13_3KG351281 [Panicum virgatum]